MKVSGNKVSQQSLANLDSVKSKEAEAIAKSTKADLISDKTLGSSKGVAISDRAQMMKRAKEIASQPDAIDEAKVARLQKMIDEGKYNVDAKAIADRLVDSHMEMES